MTQIKTTIDAGTQDMSRPSERPPKSNWKIELLKKGLFTLQYVSPKKTSEIVWHHFTKPGKVRFTQPQEELLKKASISYSKYRGHKITTYRWGEQGPKVLMCHGWRSKMADFRRMIEALVAAGYVVEGLDMTAHGKSEGKHSALPEFRYLLKNHYVENGPYQAMIGYSLGGLASGIVASELSNDLKPQQLFMISAPPYVRYFFKDVIDELGYRNEVFEEMCKLVEKDYHEPIDYFDLRQKAKELKDTKIHLIYDENDQTVPFERGLELYKHYPRAQFVHTKGLGHYKIIAYQEVIEYIIGFATKKWTIS
ncbi:alpha/beta hydrolase [Marinoscillum furvescens]|uniref:Pimeloyl-ACP methyl ester carboxylesterase n=1 Tax=Marinoscillum furvescens DSM 4134 TaxID=1122208 RepID=A0A3D9L403_MARFU|nr:alpha/beta hydrolase [Marinoscillum furvescens]RED98023.1 pimeloyl-ACP methyl ester carboxylesterase [Marinoscillum furvescens DSM 4134]